MKNSRVSMKSLTAVTLFAALGLVWGCGSGDTGGGTANDDVDNKDQFVSNGGSGAGGSLTLTTPESINVGDIDDFFVRVLDSKGQGVSDIRVFCESERGIAIIEPNSGGVAFENTNDTGGVSGKVGGVINGSYRMECRGPIGFNLKDANSIRITGDIPEGFTGFPGAAGGNLGGGSVVIPNDGGSSISAISFSEAGDENVGDIDTSFVTDCDSTTDGNQPEPFTETDFTLTLRNGTINRIFVTGVRFTTTYLSGASQGTAVTTPTLSVNAEIASGASASVSGTYMTISGSTKTFAGTGTAAVNGDADVDVTVTGTDSQGNSVTLSGSTTLTFRGVNRCDSTSGSSSSAA